MDLMLFKKEYKYKALVEMLKLFSFILLYLKYNESMINIITQLNTLISTSNPSDISFIFASYVKGNMKNIEKMSIDEIAQVCNTSTSSISRLVSKMGYSSYKDFRKECKEALVNIRSFRNHNVQSAKEHGLTCHSIDSYFNTLLIPLLHKIKQSDVDKMTQWLSNSNLYFFGSLDIHFILEELQATLSARSTGAPIVLTNLGKAQSLKKSQCLIIISMMGNSIQSPKAIEQLKKCQAKKYLLTSRPEKINLSLFDDIIQLPFNESGNTSVNNYIIRFFLEMVQTQMIVNTFVK